MNRTIYIYVLLLIVIISACSKTMELGQLDFDASIAQETVTAGEEITFDLRGHANIVTFYSGEMGKDYQYREGRPLALSQPQVSFSSDAWFGTQTGQISILVSTEFNGDYTAENIRASLDAGEWIDITDEFELPENTGTRQTVANGPFDLSDIITAEKKGMYFVFRNRTTNAGAPTQWTFSRFLVTANTVLGRQTLVDISSADWTSAVLGAPGNPGGPSSSGTSVWFPRGSVPDAVYDNWIITKKIEFTDQDLGPDVGEPIKSYADPQLTEFEYTYDVPGTYVATFLASNVNAKAESKVVKQVKVIVEP